MGAVDGKLKDHRHKGDGLALYILTAGGALHHVLTTARPEPRSGATPHRSNYSVQWNSAYVNYIFDNLI